MNDPARRAVAAIEKEGIERRKRKRRRLDVLRVTAARDMAGSTRGGAPGGRPFKGDIDGGVAVRGY